VESYLNEEDVVTFSEQGNYGLKKKRKKMVVAAVVEVVVLLLKQILFVIRTSLIAYYTATPSLNYKNIV
jgi:hypothetical protein